MYGMRWRTLDRAVIEGAMYDRGGYFTAGNVTNGHGAKYHFRELIKALAPWFEWHKYNELIVDAWAEHDTIAILGPASSGKTFTCAMCAYAEFYAHPLGTSILCSSITLPGLRLRVWGALTEIVRRVKQLRPDAPGHVVESDLRVYPAEPGEGERRSPKDAIIGMACKLGDEWVGIGCFPAGTQVDTPNGTKSIESLDVGDEVCGADCVTTVVGIRKRLHVGNFIRLTLDNGTVIVSTPDHRHMIHKDSLNIDMFATASSFVEGDEIVVHNGTMFSTENVAKCESVPPEEAGIESHDGRSVVYDIEVEDALHCFRVNGVVTHNSYVGLHNDRVIGIFDEASLMPRTFWDATANLRKSPQTKFVAIGNPKDTNDALGVIAEPHKSIGGWEGLGTPVKTCTWPTVGTNSIAIQLHGLDGPNFGKDGVKFKYLITPKQVEEDKLRYGEDSWQFQMMDLGVMPKGVGSRRVFTRQMCERGNAFGEPWWDEATPRVDYLGLDAAFCLDDGDRTALVRLTVGKDVHGYQIAVVTDGPIIIPVSGNKFDDKGKPLTAEDQISLFVMQYAQANNIAPHRFGFDSTGRGVLAVAFAKHWSPHIVPVEFGGKAPERQATTGQNKTERELYGKMVTALWFAARNAVIAGQIRNLPMSVFEEGAMREYIVTKDGKEDVEEKKITRQRLGKSPDLMDAFVVALEVARRNGFVVGGRSGTAAKPVEVKWLTKKQDGFLSVVRSHQLTR